MLSRLLQKLQRRRAIPAQESTYGQGSWSEAPSDATFRTSARERPKCLATCAGLTPATSAALTALRLPSSNKGVSARGADFFVDGDGRTDANCSSAFTRSEPS